MKPFMTRTLLHATLLSLMLTKIASAGSSVVMDFVPIGNLGNAADPNTGYGPLGSVGYKYPIARNETTAAQYCTFLNSVAKADPYRLYSSGMGFTNYIANISRTGSSGSYSYSVISGDEQRPVTLVSWFDAARFCNWMQNGQGSGSTETGAYTLNGAMSGLYSVNAGAQFWIPTENEWYKAAYYDPTNGPTGGYWKYPSRTNTVPGNTVGVTGAANYDDGDYVGYPGEALTEVGVYGANSASYYGTNDQGGNAHEWLDFKVANFLQSIRGGSALSDVDPLGSNYRLNQGPDQEYGDTGFRIATIPEPSAALLVAFGSFFLTRRMRSWDRSEGQIQRPN
jgi:formylglycine-generating enzyme